jgi:hypothetical protein
MTRIRIVDIPFGDAPKHVRSAWIGLDLPLADIGAQQPQIYAHHSVLSGWRLWLKNLRKGLMGELEEQPTLGYVVSVADAFAVLSVARPEAAAWWRQNTPHLFTHGGNLLFQATCCTEIPASPSDEP